MDVKIREMLMKVYVADQYDVKKRDRAIENARQDIEKLVTTGRIDELKHLQQLITENYAVMPLVFSIVRDRIKLLEKKAK